MESYRLYYQERFKGGSDILANISKLPPKGFNEQKISKITERLALSDLGKAKIIKNTESMIGVLNVSG